MNVLVPVASVADVSNQPTSKWVVVTVAPLPETLPEGSTQAQPLAVAASSH